MMLEQLLFLVVFLLVILVSSVLVESLKRQQRMAQEGEPEAPVVLPNAPLRLSPPMASLPTPHEGPRGASLPEPPPPDVTRRRARARVGSLRDVRRGIVLMTILGPCRALESPRPPQ